MVVAFIKINIQSKMMITGTTGSPPVRLLLGRNQLQEREDPKNAFLCGAVACVCLSYLIPPTLCLRIESLQCPTEHQCDENSDCLVDPLTPNKTQCVCRKGFRETADGMCIGKLPY